MALCVGAASARAADLQVKGGRRSLHVVGEAGVAYHPVAVDRPVQAMIHGPGRLDLRLRAQNATGDADHAELQILVDGTDLLDLDLEGTAGGAFEGHPDSAPGRRVNRQVRIGEGSHAVLVKVTVGAAVVAFAFERDAPEPVALAPLEAAPLAPAPLTAAPLAAPPAAEPLAPAPAAPPPVATATPEPVPPAAAAQDKAAEPEGRAKSTIPYYLLGGAVLVGGGSLIAWGLGQSAYGNYKSTPEVRGGSLTNRGEILSQANNDVVWAQALGLVAVAALASAAIVWSF